MASMADYSEIPFQELLDTLLDVETHLHPRYLYRLSDLDPTELEALAKAWHRVPLWRRQALMEDLQHLGSVNNLLSFEALGRYAVRDEDPQVRNLAVRILWEFEAEDLVPLFISLMETDNDVEVRASAASALGRFVYQGELDEIPEENQREIENRLLQLVESDEPVNIRRCALASVSYSGRPEVPELIDRAFTSGQKEWMETALLAMGRSIDQRWENHVIRMLDSKFPALRREAARASGKLELEDAVDRLIELLDDSDEDVRRAAIWSLSEIGGQGVREAIEELLESADEYEEIRLLEAALDNLSFTEDFHLFSLFNFPENDIEAELLDLIGDEEEYLYFNIDENDEDMQD